MKKVDDFVERGCVRCGDPFYVTVDAELKLCIQCVNEQHEERVMKSEAKRMNDYDDGIIWDDDH